MEETMERCLLRRYSERDLENHRQVMVREEEPRRTNLQSLAQSVQ